MAGIDVARAWGLFAVLVASAGLYALITPVQATAGPRWPAAQELFAVEGWSTAPPQVDTANGEEDEEVNEKEIKSSKKACQ